MVTWIQNFINVESSDPDDARRRRLLNILLAGIIGSAIVGSLGFFIYAALTNSWREQDATLIFLSSLIFTGGSIGILFLNRRFGNFAAILFLLLLTFTFSLSDSPEQLADGRSIFVYAIPIAIASLLLRPVASFIFAGLSSIIITGLALSVSIIPNIPAIIGFFMLALVSWLSSRSLENALRDLRVINANLDRIVAERTQALSESLSREQIEAGRSQAILESIADGVVVYDLHSKAIQANPALSRLLDIPFDQIIQSTINQLTHSDQLDPKYRDTLEHLLNDPGYQITSQRVEWDKKTLSVSAATVLDPDGNLIGTVGVFRDFTREAEIEKMKSSFLAIVSHELRTPLNAIIGYAEMLKESILGPINENQARASDRIMNNTERLLSIVSDLLDQAQIEAGKLTINMQPFSPSELLENVHGVMDKAAADKGLSLTSSIDPELPQSLNGDLARLQQILVNLTNNAIKFTDSGSVQIRFKRLNPKKWALEVLDTGRGIAENEIPKIFETFQQVGSAATREHGGFGLGLSIVKQLAELMGGTVTVKSQEGLGSTFTITLPLIQNEKTEEKNEQPSISD
jgi:PAS domain S-box-containing protein